MLKNTVFLFTFLAVSTPVFAFKSPFKTYLKLSECPKSFKVSKQKDPLKEQITAYKLFSCFPLKSLDYLKKKFSSDWAISSLPYHRVLSPLTPQKELSLYTRLYPYQKAQTSKEKFLLKIINLKKKLKLNFTDETQKLWEAFPSYDPAKTANPDMKVIKDLKRRGLNSKSLEILKNLNKERPYNLDVLAEMVRTQKNIRRNYLYLHYSDLYSSTIKKLLNKNKKSSKLNSLYLEQELLNIRRIWTYGSTDFALKRLNLLIKSHCKKECPEHFWIKGRILEELNRPKEALVWLIKAVETTPPSHKEYQNRLWNLVWLQNKTSGSENALLTAKKYLEPLKAKNINSKLYYWMSEWSTNPEEKKEYVELIKKHHPMSFYLWSDLALGEGLPLENISFKKFFKSLKKTREKNLYTLLTAEEPLLTRSYIRHVESSGVKKNIKWKKLKALSGMYADLLLDLEKGSVSVKDSLPFFFSRNYKNDVLQASKKFKVEKELIWSIIRQESNFNPYARSWADALGLMQILPRRAANYKKSLFPSAPDTVDINEIYRPQFNISVGAWLIQTNLQKFDNRLPLTIAAYNASIKKVRNWESRFLKQNNWMGFIEEITYRETRKYVKLVLRNKSIYHKLESI